MKIEKCKLNSGFTLIEILIAVLLLGLAVAAIVGSNSVFTQNAAAAKQISEAEFLISQIKEFTAAKSYAELINYNNTTYNPPQDCTGGVLSDYAGYSQRITAYYVVLTDLKTQIATADDFTRLEVEILYNGSAVAKSSWLRSKR